MLSLFILAALFSCVLAACSGSDEENTAAADGDAELPRAEEYADKRIAVMTGTNFSDIVTEQFPSAEQVFFNTIADMLAALNTDKVDAIAMDEPVARSILAENENTAVADGYLAEFDFAYILPKTEEGQLLCDELSEFMRKIKEDGRLEELQNKWFDVVPDVSMMPFDPMSLPDTNGTIKVAVLQYPPFVIMGQEMFFGYDAELLGLFGKEKGYRIDMDGMNADAIIPAIQSVRYDMGAAATAITEERKETILFSEPEYSGGVVLIIKSDAANSGSFVERIENSFHKTFIRENRYRMFISGIGVTILIAALSAIFGTLLGFVIYMSCRRGNPAANAFARLFGWLMSGMPMVVLLMILYYIVFANLPVNGTVVSVIAFAMSFGAEVYGMLSSAVSAVGSGQMEAAYALGYTDRHAFFRHILPQALPHFMPSYRGTLVGLIKSTSIVGYVAVQDLTKIADIIRGRTYEAFFPLIAVAIIYYILAALLIFTANRATLRMDPTRRNKEDILEGVNIHD